MAQRVGSISNYKPSKKSAKGFDLPATFEVLLEGDQYSKKCSAWPTVGTKADPKPNPVIARIESMTALQMAGPWLIGGYEQKGEGFTAKDGTQVAAHRKFYATEITEAAPGAKHEYDLDRDGNPVGESNDSAPTNGHASFDVARYTQVLAGVLVEFLSSFKPFTPAEKEAAISYIVTETERDLGNPAGSPQDAEPEPVPF